MRNLRVFYLDVQSAGSLGDDGQSAYELQAVLSVLSQLLGFVIRLFGSLVSGSNIAFHRNLPPWFQLSMQDVLGVVLCVCSEHPESLICLLRCIMYIDPLSIFALLSFHPNSGKKNLGSY